MINEQTKLVLDSLKVDGDTTKLKYCKNCKKIITKIKYLQC